jgi:hypothetical protein
MSLVGTPLNFHIIKISSFADICMAILHDCGTGLLGVAELTVSLDASGATGTEIDLCLFVFCSGIVA